MLELRLLPIEIVDRALVVANQRLAAVPDFQLFASIVAQLSYVRAVLSGAESDRSRLKAVIVGHYAVREFSESDPEFAAVLMPVQNIASKMAKGLKI